MLRLLWGSVVAQQALRLMGNVVLRGLMRMFSEMLDCLCVCDVIMGVMSLRAASLSSHWLQSHLTGANGGSKQLHHFRGAIRALRRPEGPAPTNGSNFPESSAG